MRCRDSAPILVVLLSSFALACDDATCVDTDLDGFGADCASGPDCDDGNALRTSDCEAVPAPDCTETPFATGCPCLSGAEGPCYSGPPNSADIGACAAGVVQCVNQRWGLCDGDTLPERDFCNAVDDDCDGFVDEGVESPCGDCDPLCVGEVWGGQDHPFDAPPPTVASGLVTDDNGFLTLAWQHHTGEPFVWIPNSAESTVSKIDTRTATEVARYRVGEQPSRVAVDYDGNAWVANRAFDDIPSVTKISTALIGCADRDNNRTLDTSSGPTDVLPAGQDECVLFTAPVGATSTIARALAIDGERSDDHGGNPWVGLFAGEEVVALDGRDGSVRTRIAIPGFQPYGAHFDRWGILWLSAQDGRLLRIDSRTAPPAIEEVLVPYTCFRLYSFAIHVDGRLFLAGHSCDQALRFDPLRGRWDRLPTYPSPRGVTVLGDDVYLTHTGGLLSRLSADPFRVEAVVDLHTLGRTPFESIGISADPTGALWIASSQDGPSDQGVATKIEDDAVSVHVPVGRGPHTQGDLTGSQLLGGFVPEGSVSRIFSGCGANTRTRYERVHVRDYPGATGTVVLAARHAEDEAGLAAAPFVALGDADAAPPYPLSFPEGGLVELRITLRTRGRLGAPRLQQVGLEWQCTGPI